MISNQEVKVLDKNAEYYDIPASLLMENAGKGLGNFIIKNFYKKVNNIFIICGTGNNGGDGFVTARYLNVKFKVSLFLVGKEKDIKTEISRLNFKKIKKLDNITIYDINSLFEIDKLMLENDILIDSMLGIGITGNLREPYLSIVTKFNNKKGKIKISVDIPTGLGNDTVVNPDYTVTFHDEKFGMNPSVCGKIKIIDIGVPKEAIKNVGPGELYVYYPRSDKYSHKGENGKVLIVGGGPYIGAPALSGLAALRTGCDLVFIATPKRSFLSISNFSPNFIVKDLKNDYLSVDDLPIINDLLTKCDTLIIGPGLGVHNKTDIAVIKIIEQSLKQNKSIVVDADAINIIGKNHKLIKNSKIVVTPHINEFTKLTGDSLPLDYDIKKQIVERWANKLGISIFLKGPVDILTDGINTKFNKLGNEAMTVGGTGDVLAGIIGALLSKGLGNYNAMRTAAFIIGESGDMCFNKKSYGLISTDIIDEIPNVLKKYL